MHNVQSLIESEGGGAPHVRPSAPGCANGRDGENSKRWGLGRGCLGAVPPEIFLIFALVQIAFLSILNPTCVTFQCYMCNLSADAMIVIIALDRSCRENLQSIFCVATWPICSSVTVTKMVLAEFTYTLQHNAAESFDKCAGSVNKRPCESPFTKCSCVVFM